jgi:hypothetical protein
MTPLLEWDVNDSAATRGSEKNAAIKAEIVARPLKTSRRIRPRCHLNICIITLPQAVWLDLLAEKMEASDARYGPDVFHELGHRLRHDRSLPIAH